jgi:hypothetical protein
MDSLLVPIFSSSLANWLLAGIYSRTAVFPFVLDHARVMPFQKATI